MAVQSHGKVAIFGKCIGCKCTGFYNRIFSKSANGTGYHGYAVEQFKSPAIKILRGNILNTLPAGNKVYLVTNLYITGNGSNIFVCKFFH